MHPWVQISVPVLKKINEMSRLHEFKWMFVPKTSLSGRFYQNVRMWGHSDVCSEEIPWQAFLRYHFHRNGRMDGVKLWKKNNALLAGTPPGTLIPLKVKKENKLAGTKERRGYGLSYCVVKADLVMKHKLWPFHELNANLSNLCILDNTHMFQKCKLYTFHDHKIIL